MATVLKMPARDDAPTLGAAYYTLACLQRAIEEGIPEAKSVGIRLEPSGALKAEIVVGGQLFEQVEMQQRILFKVEAGMPGIMLLKPTTGFENGKGGRRMVTALIDPHFGDRK